MPELRPCLLIIGRHWPEPDSSAAGVRMMQLIRELTSDFSIVFASPSPKGAFSADLSQWVEAEEIIRINDSSFDAWIKALHPAVVIFDRFISEEQFGWRVEMACPDALRVLDTEDLHGLREARRLALISGREMRSTDLKNDIALREVAAVYRSDLSLIVSRAEFTIALNEMEIPEHLLCYFPLLADLSDVQTSAGYEGRRHFMTIGTFKHAPNSDAAGYLKEAIWPLIRSKIPDAEMHVYGAYLNSEMAALEDADAGFFMKGRANDVNEVMSSYRVCLAPLRFGAGIKGKLLTAMKNGMPSVTTSIGAEGIIESTAWPGAVEDDSTTFAMSAVDLYLNETSWSHSVSRIPMVLDQFDANKWKGKLASILSDCISTLHTRRSKSFTAAVIGHHSLKSTRYLSQLIELKNKYRVG